MAKLAVKAENNQAYHHGNLRNALMNAALDAMASSGVSEFSLSELARKVGVTPAAAYKHFADKQSLLEELAQHGFLLLKNRFEIAAPIGKPAANSKQAVARFERVGCAYLEFGLHEPALFNLIFGKSASSFRQKVSASGQRTPTFAYLALALEALHEFGVIKTIPTAQQQWFAWSAIHGATELHIAGIEGLVKSKDSARVITDQIIKALQ